MKFPENYVEEKGEEEIKKRFYVHYLLAQTIQCRRPEVGWKLGGEGKKEGHL